ncbi:hypothetical protein AB1Y20_007807 [Prymnesium parvum]|uniref:Thioredoxin domain-containing protein n=1 Tax=Prymnesium parvum TaxID=97485 RepID=A0AB34IVB8_PRYPA
MAASLSTAALKRALQEMHAPPERLAACIERHEFEALHRELSHAAPTFPHAAKPPQSPPAAAAWRSQWPVALVLAVLAYSMLQRESPDRPAPLRAADGELAALQGSIVELSSLEEFEATLALHRDATALPLVVDFYSDGCGPCRMIAPTFRALATEYAGRAAFASVNVNYNHETARRCEVRAMPTFHFYTAARLVHRFQGADAPQLRRLTASLAEKAEASGTYAGMEVSEEALREFYSRQDRSKLDEVPSLYQQYSQKTAKLVKLLTKKYGSAPRVTARQAADEGKNETEATGGGAEESALRRTSVEALRGELARREAEEEGAKMVAAPPHTSAAAPAKVVIIGGGPAGLAAAVYAARAGLSPMVIAPDVGGQLLGKGVEVENFPGAVDISGSPLTGPKLVQLMRKQAVSFDALLVADVVVAVDLTSTPFRLTLNSSASLHTEALIVATGADARWLGVDGESEWQGHGVSYCATCDGFLYRGKHVAVVGGGDTAMEDALVLARTSASVTIIHRRSRFRASHALASRVLSHPSIRVMWDSVVSSFEGEATRGLTHLHVAPVGGGAVQKLAVDAAFVAIGHDPNTRLFAGQLDTTPAGYLEMTSSTRLTQTSRPGVFACGDVADPTYRQAITSAGSGAMAALDAERWLSEGGHSSTA